MATEAGAVTPSRTSRPRTSSTTTSMSGPMRRRSPTRRVRTSKGSASDGGADGERLVRNDDLAAAAGVEVDDHGGPEVHDELVSVGADRHHRVAGEGARDALLAPKGRAHIHGHARSVR